MVCHIKTELSQVGTRRERLHKLNYIGRLMHQREKVVRIGVLVTRLLESSAREHRARISLAKKAIDILNDFIEYEVHTANDLPKNDPAHMSWAHIGSALNLSRSAAYARYGMKNDERTKAAHKG